MATNSGGAGPARPRDRLSREQEAKLSEVLKEVHPRLLTVVMRMTRDYHLAHDVTQEACLAVIQEFRRGTVFRKPVIVYATVVARNKFLSELGRMRAQLERPSDELPEGGQAVAGHHSSLRHHRGLGIPRTAGRGEGRDP
ncbi:RNA polymerase sigma factor [Streptomyces mirabilis]|uniref:RNA polymerase sigma factor n=1 Tax=Streptomyces mirabilis TaxID=68239 RepID=UPI0036A160FF